MGQYKLINSKKAKLIFTILVMWEKVIREGGQKHDSRYFVTDFGLNKKAKKGFLRVLKEISDELAITV